MKIKLTYILHIVFIFSIVLVFSMLSISCVSTNVYSKTNAQFFQNDLLVGEENSVTKNGKTQNKNSKVLKSVEIDGVQVYATIKKSSRSQYKTTNIKLYKQGICFAEHDFESKDGVLIKNDSSPTTKSTTSNVQKEIGENKVLLQKAYETVTRSTVENEAMEINPENMKLVSSAEDVKIESTPNKKYIVYSVLGKPFIILGCTAWNLVKCAGYALINFSGGYTTMTSDKFLWKMPDVNKSMAKAREAREKNKISSYPEYHIPFTNNHITVKKMTTETSNAFSDTAKEVKVTSSEQLQFDNSISVKRSASADANSTAAVIGAVGTIITIPVSVVTWIGGAAFGIYMNISDNN